MELKEYSIIRRFREVPDISMQTILTNMVIKTYNKEFQYKPLS